MKTNVKMSLLSTKVEAEITKALARYKLRDDKNLESTDHQSTSYLKTFNELFAKETALNELKAAAENGVEAFQAYLKNVDYHCIAMANNSGVYKIYKKLYQKNFPGEPMPACPGKWEGQAMLERKVFVDQATDAFKNMLNSYLVTAGKVNAPYSEGSDFSERQKQKIDTYRVALVNGLLDAYKMSPEHVEKYNKHQEDPKITAIKAKIRVIDDILLKLKGIADLREFLKKMHNTEDREGLFHEPLSMKTLMQDLIKDYLSDPQHPKHFYEADPPWSVRELEEDWTLVNNPDPRVVVVTLTEEDKVNGVECYESSEEAPDVKPGVVTPFFTHAEQAAIIHLRQQLKAESDLAWGKCDIEDGLQKDVKIDCLNQILRCEEYSPDQQTEALSRIRSIAIDNGALEGRFSTRVDKLLSDLEDAHGIDRGQVKEHGP
jgi:hypothetical protein